MCFLRRGKEYGLWPCFVRVAWIVPPPVSMMTCDGRFSRRGCYAHLGCRSSGRCSSLPESSGDAKMSLFRSHGNASTFRDASFLARVAVLPVLFYQRCISPFLGTNCRFYPSCSQYMLEAILRFGVLRGTGLGLKRLLRCGPWNPGGFDPVPERIHAGSGGVKVREDEKRKEQHFGGGERR